ncbi:acetyltransferase [Candidatus Thioglobus autotrophicus]|uniref:acetyltransferase n=1 Tax=Candidatus Thioglobus autotrophicus TaxID=1705394 RepID=UPI00299DEF5A|nr:acetyltransferase [Candidatus Thioglobus autotrophicus]WPE17764.1 acetyltransferase [Candidatus Thioglobus autotrophicus]
MHNKPIIVIGNGGHSKVLQEMLLLDAFEIIGVTDASDSKKNSNYKVYTDNQIIEMFSPEDVFLVNGVGSLPYNNSRWDVAKFFTNYGYYFLSLYHPSAIIANDVHIEDGVQLMAGVILQPGVCIGKNTIVNTGAIIDHDCIIGENCHIAPGSTLSGGVVIKGNSHVGTGASIIQGISIGEDVVIAAGSIVYKNLPSNTLYKEKK